MNLIICIIQIYNNELNQILRKYYRIRYNFILIVIFTAINLKFSD